MVRTFWYRVFLIGLVVVLTVIGIFIGVQLVKNKSDEEKNNTIYNENDIEEKVDIYTPVISKKSYDIELIYEDYYTICDESIINKNIVYGTTLDELKQREEEKQKKLNEKYDIVEESNEKLIYKRKINKYCPNHFKVAINDREDRVIVYNKEDKVLSTIYQEIEIYRNTLREELIEELKKGIDVNSKKELDLIIEDIEI